MATEARTIAVAFDGTAGSTYALSWTLENVVRENDVLIVLVVNKDDAEGIADLWAEGGSPRIPLKELPDESRRYRIKFDEGIFSSLEAAVAQKKVRIFAKVYWGDAKEKILTAVKDESIGHLVLGNRGLGTVKRAILGSVSNYVVNNASVPVTVVKTPS